MRIIIKCKDYSTINLDDEGIVSVIDDREGFFVGDNNREILKSVVRTFLRDVENDNDMKYTKLVQEVYKNNGRTVDEDKLRLIESQVGPNGEIVFNTLGVVGVMQNNSFHADYKLLCDYSAIKMDESHDESSHLKYLLQEVSNIPIDVTLQIGSRFDSEEKQFFLESMFIDETLDLAYRDNHVPPNSDSILEFLVLFLFKQQLTEAYRNGPFRKYVRFEDNSIKMRGAIDVARHIKLNAGLNNGKISFAYCENTTDNSINHLILHTVKHAMRYYPQYADSIFFTGDESLSDIITELKALAPSFETTDVKTVMANTLGIIDHPLFHYYETLRKTCRMILQFDGLSMFDGEENDVQGVLFYIPTLWEHFLENQIKKCNDEICFNSQYINMVYKKPDEKGGHHETRPDFVFFDNREPRRRPVFILDAKFKPRWAENYGKTGYVPEDFDKCVRDMTCLGCHATGVIYPMKSDISKEPVKYELSEWNHDSFFSVPISVPEIKDKEYCDWSKNFAENIRESINRIKRLVNSEKTNRVISIRSRGVKRLRINSIKRKHYKGIYESPQTTQ